MRVRSHAKALFAATVLSMLLCAPSAMAATATLHPPLTTPPGPSFDGSSTPAGSFQPQAMAVDQSNGDIYVVDAANQVLLRFDETGTIDSGFGTGGALDGSATLAGSFSFSNGAMFANAVAIDRSGTATDGNIYLADPGHGAVHVFDETGAYQGRLIGSSIPTGPFGTPDGLAVDSSGDLYIADATKNRVYRFDPAAAVPAEGDYVSQLSDPNISTPAGLAVDSAGNLYVANFRSVVNRFAGGTYEASVDFNGATAIAVDPADDHLYVDHGFAVTHYGSAAEGNPFLSSPGQGQISDSLGIAIDASSNVYISDQGQGKVLVFAPAVSVETPSAAIDPPSAISGTSAQLSGTVNPNGEAPGGLSDTTWRFEYSTDQSNWSQSAGGTVPGTTSDTPVSEEITGLKPSTKYFVRLSAQNAASNPTGGPSYSSTLEFTTAAIAPAISSGGAVEVGPTTARLIADLNPGGAATTYRFEYGTTTAYGQSVPVGGGQLGADVFTHPLSVQLTGLVPETKYHWRLVAENAAGSFEEADHAFTTLATPSAGPRLPDNRAWEQVTPTDKNGGDIANLNVTNSTEVPGLSETISVKDVKGTSIQSSEDGERINFYANMAAFANPGGASVYMGDYISERTEDGWRTQNIDPPGYVTAAGLSSPKYLLFDPALSKAFYLRPFEQEPLTPEGLEGLDGYYVRDLQDGSFRFAFSYETFGDQRFGSLGSSAPAAASEGLRNIVIRAGANLNFPPENAGTFAGQPQGLYEVYENANGTFDIRMASILPDGTPVDGDVGNGYGGPTENAVSRDGERIVFRTPGEPGGCGGPGGYLTVSGFNCGSAPTHQLYIRENGTSTRWISDYAPGVPLDTEAGASQQFWGADPDVEHVFFTSQTKLTADSTASHDGGDGTTTGSFGDLYRYDVEANGGTGELEDITVDNSSPEGAQVIGVLGNSADGERIYFVARSNRLDGEQGVTGQANLYLWDHNGGSPTTTYIATLRAPDGSENGDDRANWVNDTYKRSSEVTPSGSHILFTSKNQLTGFENAGHVQVYAYDAESEELVCTSCFGEEPATRDAFPPFSVIMTHAPASIHPHALSADGRWAFFNTKGSLVARDTNATIDAYRFDTETGRVALLSTGQHTKPSYFLAASPDGEDAFFITHEQLVRSDIDGNSDIYDARVNGGIASQNRVPAVRCEGDACQPPPVLPNDATPSSSSFAGPGDKRAKKPQKRAQRRKACRKKAAAKKRGPRKQCRHGKSTRRHG